MTVITRHRHRQKCQLITDLGLDHDTPLIEWHDWTPVVADDLPIAATDVDGWKYLQVTQADAVDRSGVEYDDSAWSTGPTPFGLTETDPTGSVVGGAPGKLTWWDTQSALWVRRIIQTAPGETVRISGQADDSVDVYWNGVHVLTDVTIGPWTVDVPAGSVHAVNVLAVRAADDDVHHIPDASYLSVGVAKTAADPRLLTSYEWTVNPDRTAALIDYQAGHGRPTPTQSTDALDAGVRLARYLLDEIPNTGDRFRLTLHPAVAAALGVDEDERPRFTGEITDVKVDANGDLSIVNVSALGRRARLNRLPVTTTRPQELDGERVRRILFQVAITLPIDFGTIEPGTVTLLESAPLAVPAQQLIDQVTADSLGQLVEHRSGRLEYHDAGHRRGLSSLVTLTGDQHLIRPFAWQQNIASVVNDASAAFGPEDDREVVRVTDPNSSDPNTGAGPYPQSLDTQLATTDDAYALLTNLVGRYSRPAWWLPSLLVDLYRTAGDQTGAVLSLSHGDKITAAGLPPDGAFTAGDVFVEGTTETHDSRAWRVDLAVADPALAGAGVRWVDLPRFLRWADVDPDLTWLDLATIDDPYALGRPVCDGGDADDLSVGLIVNGGDATTTTWDYVLSGALT